MVTPLTPISSAAPPALPTLLSSDAVAVQVLTTTIPPTEAGDQHISGRVLYAGSDGTVTIASDRGSVNVKLPDTVRATPGQAVDIDLPRDPAAPATLRAAGTQGAPPHQRHADPAASVPPQTPDELRLAAQLKDLSDRGGNIREAPIPRPQLGPGARITAQSLTLPEFFAALSPKTLATSTPTTLPLLFDADLSLPPDLIAKMITARAISITMSRADGFMAQGIKSLFQFNTPGTPTPQSPTTSFLTDTTNGILTTPLPRSVTRTNFSALLPQESNDMLISPRGGAGPILPEGPLTLGAMRPTGVIFFSQGNGGVPALPTLPGTTVAGSTQMMVVAQTPTGDVLLAGTASPFRDAAPGFFQMNLGTPPPEIGTMIEMRISGNSPPLTSQSTTPLSSHAGTPILAGSLVQTLTEILDLLAADPLIEGHLHASAASGPRLAVPLPNVANPQNLGAGVLLFLAILRSGDLSGWLNDRMVDSLRRSPRGTAALDKLTSLLDIASKRLNDAGGEWRSMPLPLAWQNHVIPAILHRRNQSGDPEQQGGGKGQNGQRFILDLNFDRMGAVQMDMLYREKNLESILRTRLPLSTAMRNVLSEKYAGAMGKTGLSGALYFQDGPGAWVTVPSKTNVDTRLLA